MGTVDISRLLFPRRHAPTSATAAPETAGADHLKALARISRLLRDRAICEKLRGTDGADAIHAQLTESMASHAA